MIGAVLNPRDIELSAMIGYGTGVTSSRRSSARDRRDVRPSVAHSAEECGVALRKISPSLPTSAVSRLSSGCLVRCPVQNHIKINGVDFYQNSAGS
jgi:hypothetical protein